MKESKGIEATAVCMDCIPERETLAQLTLKMGKQVGDCLRIAEQILSTACGLERKEAVEDAEIISVRDEVAYACYRLGRLQSALDDLWNEVHV